MCICLPTSNLIKGELWNSKYMKFKIVQGVESKGLNDNYNVLSINCY